MTDRNHKKDLLLAAKQSQELISNLLSELPEKLFRKDHPIAATSERVMSIIKKLKVGDRSQDPCALMVVWKAMKGRLIAYRCLSPVRDRDSIDQIELSIQKAIQIGGQTFAS